MEYVIMKLLTMTWD